MTERRSQNPADSFALYRVVSPADTFLPWQQWKANIIHLYPDTKIPPEVEEHLGEWYTLRNRVLTGQVTSAQFVDLQNLFSEEHSELFDSDTNIEAIKKITEKFQIKVQS